MRIIISPAKKMNVVDTLGWKDLPVFIKEAQELKSYIQGLSYAEAKALWKCNDKLAKLNYRRFAEMDLDGNLSPAILSYEGLQYQYMAPEVMEQGALDYIQKHLRILSGFYGVLKPFDGIVPYRLEMQARVSVRGEDLYSYWGNRLYRDVTGEGDRVILNLASKEYSRCIEAFLKPEDRFITVIFGEKSGNKVIQKGTMAKMARGEMVRYMAEKQAEYPEDICSFDRLGYRFHRELGDSRKYVFIKES